MDVEVEVEKIFVLNMQQIKYKSVIVAYK